jgi:RNA polymerase sigma factor (sigma-70 family)
MPRPIPEPAEEMLCRLAQGGDIAARNALVLIHRPLALHLARRYRRQIGVHILDPDDWAQEAIVGLMRAIGAWRPGHGMTLSSFASMCIRQHFSRLCEVGDRRQHMAHVLPGGDSLAERAVVSAPDRHPDWIDTSIDRVTLAEALRTIDGRDRDVLLLRVVEERMFREIAAQHGFSMRRAQHLLERATTQLRERLESSYA